MARTLDSRTQTYPHWILARWVHYLNPAYRLAEKSICEALRSGEVLATIIALADSAHILNRVELGRQPNRNVALSNLRVILQHIYGGSIPCSINAEKLYTTKDPEDWWRLLAALFFNRVYLLQVKKSMHQIDRLRALAREISFPLDDSPPGYAMLYVFLLYFYLPVPDDILSLITLRPKTLEENALNWHIIGTVFKGADIELMFTARELAQMRRGADEPIHLHFIDYVTNTLHVTLASFAATADKRISDGQGRGCATRSVIQQLKQKHPDRGLYYAFADYFVIVYSGSQSQHCPSYVSRREGHRVVNMFVLNRYFAAKAMPCTLDHSFFLLRGQIARNVTRLDCRHSGSAKRLVSSAKGANGIQEMTSATVILTLGDITVVTALGEFAVSFAEIAGFQHSPAGDRVLLIVEPSTHTNGLHTLLIQGSPHDVQALVQRLQMQIQK